MTAPREQTQTERIASRIDPAVGFDPVTILSIIGILVNVFVNCWRANHPTAEQASKALREEYSQRPKRLLRRMKRAAQRESQTPLTDAQAEAIAQAMIDEALSNHSELLMTMRDAPVVAFAAEEPTDENDD